MLQKQTNTSSPPVFNSNHPILSETEANLVRIVVLKYIMYEYSLTEVIPVS